MMCSLYSQIAGAQNLIRRALPIERSAPQGRTANLGRVKELNHCVILHHGFLLLRRPALLEVHKVLKMPSDSPASRARRFYLIRSRRRRQGFRRRRFARVRSRYLCLCALLQIHRSPQSDLRRRLCGFHSLDAERLLLFGVCQVFSGLA